MVDDSDAVRRDVLFDDAISACDAYAIAMQHLHAALASAHLSHVEAALTLRQSHAELSRHFIPRRCRAHVVVDVPSFELQEQRTASDGSDSSGSDASDNKHEGQGDKQQAGTSTVRDPLHAAAERASWRREPMTWFCTAPPIDLVVAKQAFVDALRAACDVAKHRRRALDALQKATDSPK